MARLRQLLDRPFEPRDPEAKAPARPFDRADRPLKGWRTVKELREELRFPSDDACRAWLRRHGIVGRRRGRVILVSGVDVDRAMRGL